MFRRREGHLLAAHLGPSLRPRFVLRFSSFTRRFLIPRFAACGPSSGVVHSPFFVAYVFFFAVLYSRRVHLLELTDVFPVCGRPRLQPSFSVSPHSCVRVPRSFSVQGQSDVFPDRVRVRGHIHFFVFLPFHCSRVCGSRVAPLCLPF